MENKTTGSESEMSSKIELDLRGVGLPLSLLKCKNTLMGMNSDDVLEVLVHDPGVVEDLVKIIRRSQGRATTSKKEGDHYRIYIGTSQNSSQ